MQPRPSYRLEEGAASVSLSACWGASDTPLGLKESTAGGVLFWPTARSARAHGGDARRREKHLGTMATVRARRVCARRPAYVVTTRFASRCGSASSSVLGPWWTTRPRLSTSDGEHLLLAAGERASQLTASGGQPREELVDVREGPPPRPRGDGKIFLERQRREHVACLRHVADAEARPLVDGQTRDRATSVLDLPGVERGVPHDRAKQGRLADTVAPEHGQGPALGQRHAHVLQHDGLAVAGPHVTQDERVSHGARRDRRGGRADRRRSRRAPPRTAPRPGRER